jgi:hypothetical protein
MTCEELALLHRAVREHCTCAESVELEELCAGHRLLGDEAELERCVSVRRRIWQFVRAELVSSVHSQDLADQTAIARTKSKDGYHDRPRGVRLIRRLLDARLCAGGGKRLANCLSPTPARVGGVSPACTCDLLVVTLHD